MIFTNEKRNKVFIFCVLFSDTDSETDSEGSVKKKKTNTPEVKIEYKTGPETWDNELNKDYYRRSAEYDELNVNFPPTSVRFAVLLESHNMLLICMYI